MADGGALSDRQRRHLEIILGADPTEEEVSEFWDDLAPRDRLLRELRTRCAIGDRSVHHYHISHDGELAISRAAEANARPNSELLPKNMIESYDIELFRAKLRAEFGSLAAILDGIDICQEHQLTLPRWLASRTAEILASVTYRRGESPVSDHHFKMERKHLALQQRMKLMREVLAYERGKEGYKGSPFHCEFAEALERVEVQVGIEKWSPSSMTDQEKKASEIVHHILKQTWAQAGADTIAVDYKSARTASIYSVDRLTRKQVDYLSWDLEAIRPSTFENLGISRVEIVSDPT